MRTLVPVLLCFASAAASGQSCPGDGESWGAFADSATLPAYTDGSVPEDAIPGILENLRLMAAPFAAVNPRPLIGEVATHTRSIQAHEPRVDGLWSYEMRGRFLPRACSQRTGQLDALDDLLDKRLDTVIQVNSLQMLLNDLALPVGGRPTYSLARRDGTLGGYPAFASEWIYSGRAVLFARGGQLPLKPVTQRQYLETLLQRLGGSEAAQGATADETETFLRQLIAEARDMPPGADREQLLAEYERTLEEYLAGRPAAEAMLAGAVSEDAAAIRAYLESTPAATLDGQAITYHSNLFLGSFPDAAEDGAYPLVQIDDGYFDGERPGDAQLLVLQWNWSEEESATASWRAAIEAKFPLVALQRIVDGEP